VKLLFDMNFGPDWAAHFRSLGHDSRHWSDIGKCDAPDREILGWAKTNGFVVVTQDLGFAAILVATGDRTPSVIQVRRADGLKARVAAVAMEWERVLRYGAIVSFDVRTGRTRGRLLM
jgi:predicted nuclease of predicted toxin-antitoxin system